LIVGLEKLRRYDWQARYAVWLAVAAVLPFLAGAYLAASRYDGVLGQIIYGANGRFVPAFAVSVLASLVPATCAFFLGLNSAGQRRNDRSAWSWIGFFLGGLIATFDLVLLIAFLMLRLRTV
jgi:hypothetical protein